MAELGALPDVVEKCLNHTEVGKVKRIYQRAQYEGPMREAWKLLGSRLALLQDKASWVSLTMSCVHVESWSLGKRHARMDGFPFHFTKSMMAISPPLYLVEL